MFVLNFELWNKIKLHEICIEFRSCLALANYKRSVVFLALSSLQLDER